jgi:hypothetical protein
MRGRAGRRGRRLQQWRRFLVDRKAPRPLPLFARSRGRAAAALVARAGGRAPTRAVRPRRDEGARTRIHRGLRAAMHVLRDRDTAVGCGSGHARRPQAPTGATASRATVARAGKRSPRGCARVSRRLQRSARSVRCPRRARGRGRARSEAPSRAASANRRTGTAARAPTRERERSGALRRRKVLLVRRLVLAVHAAGREGGVGPPRWLSLQSRSSVEAPGAPEARSGERPSGRERRSGERAAGRSG